MIQFRIVDLNMTLGSKNHERKVLRKQKRLQHLITNDSGVVCCDMPTQVFKQKQKMN